MCIIIANKGERLSKECLENCFDNNSDGAGLAWAKDNATHAFKTMKKEEIIAKYNELKDAGVGNMLLHFRIKTHGDVSLANVHPFDVHGLKMMHNGIIHVKYYFNEIGYDGIEQKDFDALKLSDTAMFAAYLQVNFPSNFVKSWHAQSIISKLIGDTNNKLAFLSPDSSVVLINEQLGHYVGENWFSNKSYEKKTVYVSPASSYSAWRGSTTYYCGFCKGYSSSGYNSFRIPLCNRCEAIDKAHLKDTCDLCHADTSKFGTWSRKSGMELCLDCENIERANKSCKECKKWGACLNGLCWDCTFAPDTKTVICTVCPNEAEGYNYKGHDMCLECIRLVKKNKTVQRKGRCILCKTESEQMHLKVRHELICFTCLGVETTVRSLCHNCNKMTASHYGDCWECGMPKTIKEDVFYGCEM